MTQQPGEDAPALQVQETEFWSSSPIFVRATNDPFDQGGDSYYETGFFTDDAFENERYTLRFDTLNQGFCSLPPDKVCYDVYANVYAISRAYFDYAKSFIAYEALGGDDNPLGEPVRIVGNVDGGLGFFAGRTRTSVRIVEQ